MSKCAEIEAYTKESCNQNPIRKPNTKFQKSILICQSPNDTSQEYQLKCKFPGGFTWRNILWKGKRHDKGKMRDQILPWGHIFHWIDTKAVKCVRENGIVK